MFPSPSGSNPGTTNDFAAGTAFGSISVASTWTIAGNRIGLTRGISIVPDATLEVELPIDLLADQTWNNDAGVIDLHAPLTTSGHDLDLHCETNCGAPVLINQDVTGGGTISTDGVDVSIDGASTVDAAFNLTRSGALRVGGGSVVTGPVQITEGSVGGGGGITGNVSSVGGTIFGGLSLGGKLTLHRDSALRSHLNPPPNFDTAVVVNGGVTLDGARLGIEPPTTPPAVGSHFTLVDNRSATPTIGQLHNLPEGQHFLDHSIEFSITYTGGDGNDVVIAVEKLGAAQTISMTGGRFTEDVVFAELAIAADMPDLSAPRAMRLDGRAGTATSDDYVTPAYPYLAAGEIRGVATFQILNDYIPEYEESFQVVLSNVALDNSGRATTQLADARVVIVDDDPWPPAPPPPTTPPPAPPRRGYWMIGDAGDTYAFGDARTYGNTWSSSPVVDIEPTPSGNGYWTVNARGEVFTHGDATYAGGSPVLDRRDSVTSISSTPTGFGYWLYTSAGRVLTYGDAPNLGDMSGTRLNGPVLDSIPTPSGRGYYLVASDGGIFTFGDADFRGSMGGTRLNAPVQSLVPDPDGTGYWLVASDGGIFAFDAAFYGSMGGTPLNRPVTGMVGFGNGYLMVGEDGGIFTFGAAPFFGSLGANPPTRPIVSVAVLAR